MSTSLVGETFPLITQECTVASIFAGIFFFRRVNAKCLCCCYPLSLITDEECQGKRTNLGKGEMHPSSSRLFYNSIWQYNIIKYYCHFSKICKPALLPTRQVVDFSLKEIKYLWRFAYLSLSAANSNTVSASRTTAAWPGWLLFRKSLALETVLNTLLLILKFHLSPIETNQYLINLLVLNVVGT